ncbi:uncharacterized protein SAMN05877753_103454 [Bacillus oleivorans]|uniref:DUF418 domain-containing protein n=1 Tax=Bacillus oleivorans TaxID=1448271 RepID=A0A285CRB4_9BACI|nr:DUF418 domain-containing protein [Bacillus oleivorans]SNX70071.1 uncharacterized protein SAMN05877753_103454 [Bacillus oleivorans]
MNGETANKERIVGIDAARGISLLGILLINMMSFHSPYVWVINPYSYWEGEINQSLFLFLEVFVAASFYPLFAFLFGFGVIKMIEKSKRMDLNPRHTLLRRFIFLLGIGIVHAFLIWTGDILITYAVTGFFLLFFLKSSVKTMITTGTLLLFIPNLLLFFFFWGVSGLIPIDEAESSGTDLDQISHIYMEGSFSEITNLRMEEWMYLNLNGIGLLLIILVSILPMVLLGAGFAKGNWAVTQSSGYFLKMGIVLFAVGIGLKMIPLLYHFRYEFIFLQDSIGGPILAAAYLFLCLSLVKTDKIGKIVTAISRAGRMSITLYLSQSIICTLIFYGYGLGQYGKVELWEGTLLALGLYLLQVACSYLWFNYYRMGPVEWVWRWYTYQEKPKLK